ncbi:ABC transporter permease [Halomonas korlensis]|uniref:Transport permease protein n=1 Tax=Halomonas korlensis TaxID=463301 RepID=A0A1I7G4Q8_9GAMM|nr:ABC transporter permease [Halomonas korlensis]SFU43418.1 lipopolysaccharide transport system permease protein [Halomonas korlensis]
MNEEVATEALKGETLPPARSVLGWPRQAMQSGNWERACERWSILRQVYPEVEAAWVQAAVAHRHVDQYEVAEELLNAARKRFPDQPGPVLELATLRCEQERLDEAMALMAQARADFPESQALLLKSAQVSESAGELDTAMAFNRLAREVFEDAPAPWLQYAELAMYAKDWETALARWAEVRARFPQHAEGFTRAADAAQAMGNERSARQLRLAREYGNAWLESLQDEDDTEEEAEHTITPPQRRDWRTFIDLVWTKARLNLKSEASKNHLRYLWWVLDPVLYMTVFYIVFGVLMERGGPGFIAYLLTGLVPFQWFAKTVQQTSNSILGGKGLMHKVRISPLFFPLVGIVQNTGKQCLVFAMLGLFLVLYGLPPTIHWLAFIPIVLVQLLLMTVVSCLLAMIVPFVRDLTNLIPTGIQFLLFSSGIFYTIDRIPEEWRSIFFANPMANLLYQYRQIFFENQWPDWSGLGWVTLGSLLGLMIVIVSYRRLEPVFPRVVIE